MTVKVWLALAGLCLAAVPVMAEDNVPPEGFRAVFNGKDLTGWYGLSHFDPRKLAEIEREHALRTLEYFSDDIDKTAAELGVSIEELERILKSAD